MGIIERYNRVNEKANKIADVLYDVVNFLGVVFAVTVFIKFFELM